MPSHGAVCQRRSSQSPIQKPTSGETISRVGIASSKLAVRSPSDPFPSCLDATRTFSVKLFTSGRQPTSHQPGGARPGEGRERSADGQAGIGRGPISAPAPSQAARAGPRPPGCRVARPSLSCPAVPRLDASLIEVYVFRKRGGRVEFLLLRRRPGKSLAGVWQPVTGKLRRGESAVRGAAREVHEETGIRPRRWWRLETVRATFDPRRDAIRIITRFAAEIPGRARVRISREHTAHRFARAREAARRVLWESQREGFTEVRHQVLKGGARARALEIAPPAGGR